MAINYRTITPQRMAAPDTSAAAAQKGAQTGFAIGAQIRARIDAARAIEKANQAAKDKWRDSQMATITDTSFVDKVDPSIHEGAFAWLKGKQQEYGDVLDALSAEGMNSKNPAWAELNNQKIRIEASFNNFSDNLDNFKKSRQTAIDMRSPNAGEGYNEVAKTLNSENALNFLVDRQFSGGYGDMQINDDGSFTFPETNYDGKPIGSDNLPTLTEMPYEQQNALIKNELAYGAEIKNGTYDINNEANNNRIRNEILTQFRGMKTDQLQAYLLNDMDGEGGTPAFISDLAPGENPTFTWNDVYGKEQSMDYQSLMTNKEAMVSFATSKEYEGTIDYMKTMVPESEKDLAGTRTANELTELIEGSVVKDASSSVPVGYDSYEEFYNDPKFKDDIERNAYLNEFGVKHGADRELTMQKSAENIIGKYNNDNIKVFPYSKMVTRDKAFEVFENDYYNRMDHTPPTEGSTGFMDPSPMAKGQSEENKEHEKMRAKALEAFNREYPLSDGNRIFNFQTINNGRTPIISGSTVDPTNPSQVMEFLRRNKYLTDEKIEMNENIHNTLGPGKSVLD